MFIALFPIAFVFLLCKVNYGSVRTQANVPAASSLLTLSTVICNDHEIVVEHNRIQISVTTNFLGKCHDFIFDHLLAIDTSNVLIVNGSRPHFHSLPLQDVKGNEMLQ